jgi:hypothetical protein
VKVLPYCFGNPALPLAVASAVRFSRHGLPPATFEVTGSILSSSLPFLESVTQQHLPERRSDQVLSWAFAPYST